MSTQFRLPRPAVASRLKKSRGLIVAALMAALILVPTASSGDYTDPSGDSGTAGDITSVTVAGDKTSGQLLFRIIWNEYRLIRDGAAHPRHRQRRQSFDR